MRQRPLVSVIMPFLNAGSFIEEAIASVLGQSFNNWELLLVDDGSRDSSTTLALHYATRYPDQIKYFVHEGRQSRGASASRNLGGSQARGGYIAYLDADDVWWPGTLEHQVGVLESKPDAGVVLGATQYWHSWTGPSEDPTRDLIVPVGAPSGVLIRPPTLLTMLYPLGRGHSASVNSVMLRRESLEISGGWEDSFRKNYTDQAFFAKLYLQVPVYITEFCCDRYRQHPNSSMATMRRVGQYHERRHAFLLWLRQFILEHKIEDQELEELLLAALRQYDHPWLLRVGEAPRTITKWALGRLLPSNTYDRLRLTLLWLKTERWHRLAARKAREHR